MYQEITEFAWIRIHLKSRVSIVCLLLSLSLINCGIVKEKNNGISIAESQIEFVNSVISPSIIDTIVTQGNQVLIRLGKNKTYIGHAVNEGVIMVISMVLDSAYYELYTGTRGGPGYEDYIKEHSFYQLKNKQIILNDNVRMLVRLNKKIDVNWFDGPILSCSSFVTSESLDRKIREFENYIEILSNDSPLVVQLTPVLMSDSNEDIVENEILLSEIVQFLSNCFIDYEEGLPHIGISNQNGVKVEFFKKKHWRNSYRVPEIK